MKGRIGLRRVKKEINWPPQNRKPETGKNLGSSTDGAGVVFVQIEQPDGCSEWCRVIGGAAEVVVLQSPDPGIVLLTFPPAETDHYYYYYY